MTTNFISSLSTSKPPLLLPALESLLNTILPTLHILSHTHYQILHPILDLLLPLHLTLTDATYRRTTLKTHSFMPFDETIVDLDLINEKTPQSIQNELFEKLITLASHSCRTFHTTLSDETLRVIVECVRKRSLYVDVSNETVFYASDERHLGKLEGLGMFILRKRVLVFRMFGKSCLEGWCGEALYLLFLRDVDMGRIFVNDLKVMNIFITNLIQGLECVFGIV